jgi:hypothetical protein
MQPSAELDDPREANEEALVARIARTMRRQLEKDYRPAATKRDAHPKHTGLFEGTFQVAADLPAELRDDSLIEPVQPGLPLTHDLRLEGAVAVAGHVQAHRANLGEQRLGRGAVAGVPRTTSGRIMLS